MSKYEELARLSVDHSRNTRAMRDECEGFAGVLMRKLANFLEAPVDSIAYREITPEPALGFGETLGSVDGSLPKMTYGRDGFWYFGVQFYFSIPGDGLHYGRQSSMFGLKKREGSFVLRFERDVVIYPSDERAIEGFCESIFTRLKDYYETPIGDAPTPIGFVA